MRHFPFLLACALLGAASWLRAEPAPGHVAVSNVRFTLARPPAGSADPWLEAAVELEVRPGPDNPGRMIRNVRVTLQLGSEVPGAAGPRFEFYRAEAEAVALASGRSEMRFYVPPEVVRRDAMRGEPRYWRAAATLAGKGQPPELARQSGALSPEETARNFATRMASDAAVNDGVLQPQYLTPFAFDHPTSTPSFVRREAAR